MQGQHKAWKAQRFMSYAVQLLSTVLFCYHIRRLFDPSPLQDAEIRNCPKPSPPLIADLPPPRLLDDA